MDLQTNSLSEVDLSQEFKVGGNSPAQSIIAERAYRPNPEQRLVRGDER
jgi:hypothetical protein